ncbi:MAG: thiamine phosphate synthase [Lacipirellulaceae bacterium]
MSSADLRTLRVLDASLNRASEGLRVVEDYARFVLDDAHLARLAKELRHELSGASPPTAGRLAARDTRADVGAAIATASEAHRPDAWSVCLASLERAQQALRSLEEFGKTVDPALGTTFEGLRYHVYTLAKALGATTAANDRLASVRLYVLVEGGSSNDDFEQTARTLCQAGAQALQLRDKALSDREKVERARRLVGVCREHGVLSIVNDRPDVAALAGADGVHVGQDELSAKDARTIVGPRGLVGVSTHSIDQARSAVLDGADYLGAGPTFPSGSKAFDEFPGIDYLRQVSAEVSLPTFAIGGITPENLGRVLAAGATRVAVAGGVTKADDPAAAARGLRDLLDENAENAPTCVGA